MDHDTLRVAICDYCARNGFTKTAKKLKTIPARNGPKIEDIFEKYLNKTKTIPKFNFKIPDFCRKQSDLRKRLKSDIVGLTPKKRPKVEKKIAEKIPGDFLKLLDELRLDRKDAKLLYENSDHWSYVKSDRQIFCVEKGNHICPYFQAYTVYTDLQGIPSNRKQYLSEFSIFFIEIIIN